MTSEYLTRPRRDFDEAQVARLRNMGHWLGLAALAAKRAIEEPEARDRHLAASNHFALLAEKGVEP